MFSKNFAIVLALIACLSAGLAAGYMLGAEKTSGVISIGAKKSSPAGNSAVAVKADLTANEARDIAAQEARQWSADAYLSGISLESKKFTSGGLSNGWKMIFYSKIKDKTYEILVKDGESRGGEERVVVDKKTPQTLKGEMIDSPAVAKSFFGSNPASTGIISLKMHYDESAKRFIWTIFFPTGSQTIDAEM